MNLQVPNFFDGVIFIFALLAVGLFVVVIRQWVRNMFCTFG